MEQRMLKFSNRWMFNRVMTEEAVCKRVIRAVLGIEAERIDYLNAEQAVEPSPDSRGVRMDVYAVERGARRVYDLEMQAGAEPFLGRRLRYYQSALDARALGSGEDYDQLPESFIVFLCTEDPFGFGLPAYRLERACADAPALRPGDGSHWVVLSARNWEGAGDGALLDLLRYVGTGEALGPLSRQIDEAVGRANEDRKWVSKVWSVSTIEENDARRRRIELRMARAEGVEQGVRQGIGQGEDRFAALADRLLGLGRIDDLKRASSDAAYRAELFHEFGL